MSNKIEFTGTVRNMRVSYAIGVKKADGFSNGERAMFFLKQGDLKPEFKSGARVRVTIEELSDVPEEHASRSG